MRRGILTLTVLVLSAMAVFTAAETAGAVSSTSVADTVCKNTMGWQTTCP